MDTRSAAERDRSGNLPGAHVVELSVLEWRPAPSSEFRTIDIEPDQRVIIVCKGGFSSSLAAARLIELGIAHATDPIGGYDAWYDLVSGSVLSANRHDGCMTTR